MAAMTRRLLHLRPNLHPYSLPHSYPLHHFSSSSDHDPQSESPQPDSAPQTSFSSKFDEIKANLKREPPPGKPHSFPSRNPSQNAPPSRAAGLNEIRQNLSEFRARSAAPPPHSSSSGGEYISLRELYRRNVDGGSATSSDSPNEKLSGDAAARGKFSFDTIRESLHQIRGAKPFDSSSIARIRDSLQLSSDPNYNPDSSANTGGKYSFPSTLQRGKGDDRNEAFGLNFSTFNDHLDLGKKLKELRPEKRKGKWFSLQELNERLTKLREIEEKKSKEKLGGLFGNLRDHLKSQDEKSKQNMAQRLDLLSHIGVGTPKFMLSPPKEELVEKYFHPDNMSSAEKLKLELKKVRDEFKMSESDCGSARVQVAQLTTKIKHLSTVLQKKDKHSRRGLQAMVQRRKKLLKYLRRTDWDSYCLVLAKLGLRDNPDIKV